MPGDFTHDSGTILATHMAAAMHHRGPDRSAVWIDAEAGVAFAHNRLSILDLSKAGHQPMKASTGRYVIIYNGEIYNHLELRKELKAAGWQEPWRGHSDTETLLAGIDHWGLEQTLRRANGMFALALWDRAEKCLSLARDRAGEKPLYYGVQSGQGRQVLLFGSEIKALRQHPAFQSRVDRNALSLFMRHNYIPAPFSIFDGINKLLPGTIVQFIGPQSQGRVIEYWSATATARDGVAHPFTGSADEAVETLHRLLSNAVRSQMITDVSLGAFLSGGIDSSTIVALMQEQSSKPVRTFTIGFGDPQYNEARFAKAVAGHLKTDHTELYVTSDQALDVIPKLPSIYDEPFADSSQIPTFLVSQLARQHVTVSLSGDAADELFAGYNRYQFTHRLYEKLAKFPVGLRKIASRFLLAVPAGDWNVLARPISPLLPKGLRLSNIGDKLHKGANVLDAASADALYYALVAHWNDAPDIVKGASEPPTLSNGGLKIEGAFNDIERMMLLDLLTYLPGDILAKVDRAAMAVSLETRTPYLDPQVIDFAWHLPVGYKLRGGQTKWPLRQILEKYVPAELIDRPKVGFGVPLDSWLRTSLRDWAEDLLDADKLRQQGYFAVDPIRKKWTEHLSGSRNWSYHLWNVLLFQSWLDAQ